MWPDVYVRVRPVVILALSYCELSHTAIWIELVALTVGALITLFRVNLYAVDMYLLSCPEIVTTCPDMNIVCCVCFPGKNCHK